MNRSACRPVPPGSTSTRMLDAHLRPHADRFIRVLKRFYTEVRVTSTRRSLDTQRVLYANYVAGCSRIPAAKPGRSLHAVGLAFDLHLVPPDYATAGRVWEALGGSWGGHYGDPIHFDVR